MKGFNYSVWQPGHDSLGCGPFRQYLIYHKAYYEHDECGLGRSHVDVGEEIGEGSSHSQCGIVMWTGFEALGAQQTFSIVLDCSGVEVTRT